MNIDVKTDSPGENPIVGFVFEFGCDAPNTFKVIRLTSRDEHDYDIERLVEKHMKYAGIEEWDRLAKETGAETVPDSRLTWRGWKFNASGWNIISDIVQEKQNKEEAEQRKEQDERDNIFKIAKETGKPQVLSTYMADCNDPEEQCSLDHVTVYAMPDGKTKKERQHTW